MKVLSDVLSHVRKRSFQGCSTRFLTLSSEWLFSKPDMREQAFYYLLSHEMDRFILSNLYRISFINFILIQTFLIVFGFAVSCPCTTDRCSAASEWADAAKSRYTELVVGGGHSFSSGTTLSWRRRQFCTTVNAFRIVSYMLHIKMGKIISYVAFYVLHKPEWYVLTVRNSKSGAVERSLSYYIK